MQLKLYENVTKSVSELKFPQDLDKLVRELFLFQELDSIDEKILYSKGNFPAGESPDEYAAKILFHCTIPDEISEKYTVYEKKVLDAFLYGSYSCICGQWMADGKKIPLQRLISLTTKLLSKGLSILSET